MKLFSAFLIVLVVAPVLAESESATLARKARKAQSAGDFTEAYLLYTRASSLDPRNKSYLAKVNYLSAKAAPHAVTPNFAPEVGAPPEVDPATVFDPAPGVTFQAPAELHPRPGAFDINLEGDYKSLFTQLGALLQLECVFDSDYEPGRRLHFNMTGADYRDALNGLAAITGSFVVPLSDKVFLVAKDLPQKRTDLEQSMSVTIQIPQYIAVQELVEIAQAVRQATGVEKLSWDNKTGSVIMRDRVSRVMPAEQLFRELFAFRSEVMIDLQLIELSRSDIVNYGINLPNVFNIAFTGQTATNTSTGGSLPSNTANPFPFNSLSYIFTALSSGGGSSVAQAIARGLFPTSLSLFSIGLGEAQALVNLADTMGKTVLTQNLRSADAQPATFHFGQKYPIVTGSYANSTTVGSQYVPTASFTFEDLGISLKVTPHVHGMNAVSMDVESEFKLLTGASVNGNPIISDRKLKSSVSLNNDEWAVVGGLQQDTDSRTVSGTAGLSNIPMISELFSQHRKEKDRSEILILMRPHLISLPADQSVRKQVWVGTETHPRTPF